MRFDIQFFRGDAPDVQTVSRRSGQFASERDAEIYGVMRRPEEAEGFRIWKDGVLQKAVTIRPEKQGA